MRETKATRELRARLKAIEEKAESAIRGPVYSHDHYDRIFRAILKLARGE